MIGLLLFALSLIGFLLCTKKRTKLGFSITLLSLISFFFINLGIMSIILYSILFIILVEISVVCYLAYLFRNEKER